VEGRKLRKPEEGLALNFSFPDAHVIVKEQNVHMADDGIDKGSHSWTILTACGQQSDGSTVRSFIFTNNLIMQDTVFAVILTFVPQAMPSTKFFEASDEHKG